MGFFRGELTFDVVCILSIHKWHDGMITCYG